MSGGSARMVVEDSPADGTQNVVWGSTNPGVGHVQRPAPLPGGPLSLGGELLPSGLHGDAATGIFRTTHRPGRRLIPRKAEHHAGASGPAQRRRPARDRGVGKRPRVRCLRDPEPKLPPPAGQPLSLPPLARGDGSRPTPSGAAGIRAVHGDSASLEERSELSGSSSCTLPERSSTPRCARSAVAAS